jgi:two-component system NtrC family sensor kinase
MQSQLVHSEKMYALGMLVSGVAHELNNPLTSILGYAELLNSREGDSRKQHMLGRVAREAKRAGRIVNNLLTFSRKHKPAKTLVDLNEILLDVLEFRAYEQGVRNIVVERHLSPDLPGVLVDPHQFQQVFLNLITNAEQAIVDSKASSGRIAVTSDTHGDSVRVQVSDNGPGIPPEEIERIFLPFFTTKEVGRGTGLGLAICYGIVEEHGGHISVRSAADEGASFVVEVPAAAEDVVAAATADEDAEPVDLAAASGRLLVVDDEAPIIELVTDFLESKGWEVESAREGTEALEVVGDGRFDVLLVDLRMPGMDGQAFFEELRRRRPELAERVIFATGDVGSGNTARYLDELDNTLLRKPFNLDELTRVIARVAGRHGDSTPGPAVVGG